MNICLLRPVHPQRFHFHLPKVVSWETGIQSGPDSLETISYTMAAMRMFSHASSQPSGSVRCPPCCCTRTGRNLQRRPNGLRVLGGLTAYEVTSSGTYSCANPKASKGQAGGGPPDTHRPPARAGAAARTLRGCWVLTNAGQFPVLPAFLMNVSLVSEH